MCAVRIVRSNSARASFIVASILIPTPTFHFCLCKTRYEFLSRKYCDVCSGVGLVTSSEVGRCRANRRSAIGAFATTRANRQHAWHTFEFARNHFFNCHLIGRPACSCSFRRMLCFVYRRGYCTTGAGSHSQAEVYQANLKGDAWHAYKQVQGRGQK